MKNNFIRICRKLEELNEEEYLYNFLGYILSLVICGIKPASTVTLTNENRNLYDNWNKYGDDFLSITGLEAIYLRKDKNFIIVLIYDRKILTKHLEERNIKSFLDSIGYKEDENLDEKLRKLQKRYLVYKCPHELGIFLGIPLDDVKDFMNSTRKKCLICGYWKVFNNCDSAKKIFNAYDKIHECAIESILNDSNLYLLSKKSKENVY